MTVSSVHGVSLAKTIADIAAANSGKEALKVLVDALDTAFKAGQSDYQKAGLNALDAIPVMSLVDVNAVEIDIDAGRTVSIKVDGVGRAVFGHADRVIIRDPFGNRYVVLRDGEAVEAVPNSPEPDIGLTAAGGHGDGFDLPDETTSSD